MPSQPPDNYERQFDFTDFSQTQPTKQQPGDKIDLELNELQQSVNDTISRLNEIQRDDGKLHNDIFDFTPMNNAVIEAQSARDDSVAAKVEAVAAKDYIVGVADGLTDSVHADAESAAQSASAALAFNNQAQVSAAYANQKANIAGTYAADAQNAASAANLSKIDAQSARNQAQASASAANSDAQAAAISAVDAENSAVAAAASAASITGITYALPLSKTGSEVSIDLSNYATQSFVTSQGYITSAALSGYATQSWVTSQSYITSAALAPYETTANAASTYATIASLGSAAYQPTTYWIQSPTAAATDGQIPAWDAATSKPVWIDNAARTLFITAKNQSGSTIPARSVVYISGATGANPLISLAQANAEATSATTIGITSAAIANGSTGQVVTAGLLSKIDTSAWSEGAGLYLSATTAGGFATTMPAAPNHGVYLGVVTRSHANQGAIEVTIKNYQELEEMSDVLITTQANNDLLVYDSASSLWKNKSFATLDLLTSTTAAATYYLATNPSGYITSADLSPYLTTATAATTYFAIPTGTVSQYLRGDGTTSTFSTDVIAAVPSASTSTAGNVQLATTAEAIAGTDATKAITPAAGKGAIDAQRVDIQTFGGPTSSGSFTWTKPAGAKFVEVYIFGAGGGGGGGARFATTSNRGGGGGGGGGTVSVWKLDAADLGSTVSVTVGAGGSGSPSCLVDNSTTGAASAGGDSIFGNYRTAGGVLGAIGSGTAGGGGASTRTGIIYFVPAASGGGGAGTANNGTPATAPSASIPLLARGGSGGAGAAANNTTQTNGATGGTHGLTAVGSSGYGVSVAGGTGGTNASPNGGTGTASPILLGTGAGGGSGAYRPSAVGGNGGTGGWPSGGGGGGSASDNGFASGAGGSGANGRVVVITYF